MDELQFAREYFETAFVIMAALAAIAAPVIAAVVNRIAWAFSILLTIPLAMLLVKGMHMLLEVIM